jgi:hypothetical protein
VWLNYLLAISSVNNDMQTIWNLRWNKIQCVRGTFDDIITSVDIHCKHDMVYTISHDNKDTEYSDRIYSYTSCL